MLTGRYGLSQIKGGLSPTAVNLGILGAGLTLGLITFQYRDTPIGSTLLGAAGSLSAVALVLFIRDLLIEVDGKKHPLLNA